MSDGQWIKVDGCEGIATVTMNRPPLNVLDMAMMGELNDALESLIYKREYAAIVIRATGKAFCAGVDVADHSADKVADMIRQFHGIFRKLAATNTLTIAAVQGAALGGGCELAIFCDFVLASDRAKFCQPEVQVGVFPPVAAAVLPLQIGLKKALEMVALGTTVRAEDALRSGLVNEVYPHDEFDQGVEAFLARVKSLSRPVVRLAKQATCAQVRPMILSHLDDAEKIYLNDLMKVNDSHEGIAAFLEKRAPVWRNE